MASWWYLLSTLVVLGAVLVLAAVLPWWPLRLVASITGGLVLVRLFIIYHDFMHGTLLQGSGLARIVFYSIGLLMLAPPRHWRFAHNVHHAHVGKQVTSKAGAFPSLTSHIGTFPLMSSAKWQQATAWQRFRYRISRHPLTILCAYVTIFFFISCIHPLARNPRKYWDGLFSLLAHTGLIALLWWCAGPAVATFSMLLPFAIAAALGAYLFYAQHAHEGLHILPSEKWTYFEGALESSSYMKLGPIMNWFTGNIGYHHVHHLNPHIPFYRLPQAMGAIAELQCPVATSLHPREVLSCFRANLWEPETQRMVSYRDALFSSEERAC